MLDIHLLSEKIQPAFARAKLDRHAGEGALVAAVACLAGNAPYHHKDLGISMVELPKHRPAATSGSRFFNQLAHSHLVFDLSYVNAQLRPEHEGAEGRVINGAGPHLIAFMLNDRFRNDVDRVLENIEPLESIQPDIIRPLLWNGRHKSLKSDIIL